MRIVVLALSLVVSPVSCLLRVSVPATAVVTPPAHHTRQGISPIPVVHRGAGGCNRERSLIGKVHRVARGGGGEEGEGILGYAASLPLLQILPPQVKCWVRCVS